MKKLIRENMSSHLITIGWNERMDTAYKRMQENRVRHLPVLTEKGEIVGMLSDRDVQRAMVSTVEHEPMSRGVNETLVFDPDTCVRDYMNWPVKTVDQHADLRLVAERMIQEKISSLLVCHGEKIIGIATVEDLLKVLIELLSDPQTGARWTLGGILDRTYHQLNNVLV